MTEPIVRSDNCFACSEQLSCESWTPGDLLLPHLWLNNDFDLASGANGNIRNNIANARRSCSHT